PGPILLIGILFVFVAGMLYSPLTSLSHVQIVGARSVDQATIESILGDLNGIPWIKVSGRSVEARVMRIEAVDHATYSQNVFGRGRLVVSYRVPVARIRSGKPVGLDATGVMFMTDQLPPDLPVVTRPESANDLPVTIVSGFPSAVVAGLAVKARDMAPHEKLSIWFDQEGSLCLNMGTGLVILGSSDDLDAKLHSLKEILDGQPGLLANLESLNLTDPSRPVMKNKVARQ
ncbi:MAG TPA: FtsQ-type POTRA domain-containing protein, partial [Fimbriimonadaceae bacterium]|nr:FtsQ-type POTRA domain-containing protein [Fimbriimonadaceae bacterium]